MKKKSKEILIIIAISLVALFTTTGCGFCYSCGKSAPDLCLSCGGSCLGSCNTCFRCSGCADFCAGCNDCVE